MIPRLLHQTYPTLALPPALQRNVDQLKSLNPQWKHCFYDDEAAERLVCEFGGDVLKAYRRIDPSYGPARADLLRHLVLYRWGGVYCDIKSGFSRPLDEVIRPDDKYIIAQWPTGSQQMRAHKELAHIEEGEFVNFFLISEPGHPFTRAAISRIVDNVLRYKPWMAVGRNGVLRTTGPIAYTLAVEPILNDHPYRLASLEELGSYYSLTDGYDHLASFKSHYSQLKKPVVKVGIVGSAVCKLFVLLRSMKAALTGLGPIRTE